MTKSKFYSGLYLAVSGSVLLFDSLTGDAGDEMFYFLIIASIWQAASYVKGDK